MSIGYSITFTQEFLMDIIRKLMDNTKQRKISYVSFEPSIHGDMALIIKYKERVSMTLDEALGGKTEWIDQRISMPITEVVI